jgi:hypothetical protein
METRQHWRDTMVDAIYVTGWTVSGLATLATILALIMKEAANCRAVSLTILAAIKLTPFPVR